MNEDLRSTARKIQRAQTNNQKSVSLDQPHPELLNIPPPPKPPPQQSQSEKDKEPAQILEPETKKDDKPPTIAGYKPEDLLTAPFKPPEPVKVETRSATLNGSVWFFIGLGVLLVIIGLMLMVISWFALGIIVALLGAIAVAASVFVPFKE